MTGCDGACVWFGDRCFGVEEQGAEEKERERGREDVSSAVGKERNGGCWAVVVK